MGSMERLRIPHIFMALIFVAVLCVPILAQTVQKVSADLPKAKEIHQIEMPVPFSLAPITSADSIEFRTVEQMTQKDRSLEADAESSISEDARLAGLEFNQGNWGSEQVVCPALPNHMFLRFKRNNGTGDVSIFSASIPRNGDGRVRIIPILMRGSSLWSPAPVNAMTISAFNHIRAEEHFDTPPKWLGIALCYEALTGGHPQAALLPKEAEDQKVVVAMPAGLEIPSRHSVILTFADVSATPQVREWAMFFDPKGELLKVTHRPVDLIPVRVMYPAPIVVKGNAALPAQGPADHVSSN
jgi:hypothetical protein